MLFGQEMNRLGFSTAKDKIWTLWNIQFSRTLKDLETYLSLTGWLWQYLPYYVQISALLQIWKTELLWDAPKEENAWKGYASKI